MDYLTATRIKASNRPTKQQLLQGITAQCFGPTKQAPLSKVLPSNFPLTIGGSYFLSIPKSENVNFWYSNWNGHPVKLVGVYNLFTKGSQIVCVQKGNDYFSASVAWLTNTTIAKPSIYLNQPEPCSCSTDTIWAKGCQCGGI